MSPQTSRFAYGALLATLLSSIPVTSAQSACGLQGYVSCSPNGGSGCCPSEWECFATECSYTGTSTAPPPVTTACPGVPAHHLCPEPIGGGCCYQAHACDPKNAKQCLLTSTQRVFEEIVTTTTVVGGSTETITSTSIFYPWPTVLTRESPSGPVPTEEPAISTTADAPETTPAPESSGSGSSEETASSTASSSTATAAAGQLGAGIGGVIGGIVAGLWVQN